MKTVRAEIPVSSRFTDQDVARAASDPCFFISRFCWTFDPRKDAYPHHHPFELYDFQKAYVLQMVEAIRNGEDLFTEKSRDMGVSWMVLGVIFWFWLYEPGFQALIGTRNESLVDNGTIDSLFGKLAYLIQRCQIQPKGFDYLKHRTYLKIINPQNGNVIKGESANANFSRQGRYRVIFMDEFAFWEDSRGAWSAAGDASPCRIVVTTPPTKVNFSKYLRFSGIIKVVTLHWRLHPKKDETWYEQQKARRTPEEVARELDINWEGSLTGRVYPEVDRVRFGSFPYRPELPLWVAHDPGHHPDPHAIGWFQPDPSTGRIRLVETFEAPQKTAAWFLPLFGFPIDSQHSYTSSELELIRLTSEWKKGIHVGDLYGRTRNEVSGTSVYDEWANNGIHVQVNTKKIDLESRKTSARSLLPSLDINDTPRNRYFLECIKSARYPDLSEFSNRVTANVVPVHDWTSHNRSMLEYFAVNYDSFNFVRHEEDRPAGLTFADMADMADNHRTIDLDY